MHADSRFRNGHLTDTGKPNEKDDGNRRPNEQLTDKLVRELPAPVAGAAITFDSDPLCFGVRVTAAGARA
jgi:hypothetical protein